MFWREVASYPKYSSHKDRVTHATSMVHKRVAATAREKPEL